MNQWLKPRLDWLLIFVPLAIGLEFLYAEAHVAIFCAASLAIIPLAGWMGKATEHLAASTGEGIGGLLNATLGNAAELIITLVAINADGRVTDVNEATIKVTGSSRVELVGTDFSEYFTEPEKAREGYRRVFAQGFVTDYPLTIRHRDGRLTDVLYSASVYVTSSPGKTLTVLPAGTRSMASWMALPVPGAWTV